MASVDNKNNYGHGVINDREQKYIVARMQEQDRNSKMFLVNQVSYLEYQQCGMGFKFTLIPKSPGIFFNS